MGTTTTQTSNAPAASAAANAAVPSIATTAAFSASTASVVTSTVTTPSFKRAISVGDYKKTRGKAIYVRDILDDYFDVGSDADMEEGKEDKETLFPRRKGPSVGTRRPRDDDSDALSSNRRRRSVAATSRTKPVRDLWMPTPSEIRSRYGNTTSQNPFVLYSCSAINGDDVAKELDLDPATDQRRNYYIGLFHELRFYGNKKHSRKGKVPELQALGHCWGMFGENFNMDPAGYRERVRLARERYERYPRGPKVERLHQDAVEAGILCAVLSGIVCER
ncbi:hypothetical protein PR003_g6268 [Phytophthora rubi]|uniref:Uncharacterized protein n=1 Tax=Phytophthora rubi TaxID=129364 RepID=A0A6A3NAI2_9STRA|nr:hypothetical protein PR002_g5954 [Phytophthora rubi]KAE9046363.1 hypothetical protein PR001_g4593 [Phytophthora rubi]KAE9348714.1 hypothetical protein PR003_g6268 [Phytophthora rubi]